MIATAVGIICLAAASQLTYIIKIGIFDNGKLCCLPVKVPKEKARMKFWLKNFVKKKKTVSEWRTFFGR